MKLRILFVFFMLLGGTIRSSNLPRPILESGKEGSGFLSGAGLWRYEAPLRLHLGCGENHFYGYINIDYPPSEHTVQTKCSADIFADITTLNFSSEIVDEIRSHHVFEHFDRGTAMALLCKWYTWLKVGGKLVIETPDFEESYKLLLNPAYTHQQKQVILRHIFGSHEASWALHKDGWYQEKFEHILKKLGFCDIRCKKSQWLVLRNITIEARKEATKTLSEIGAVGQEILRESMVDESATENKIWQTWCAQLNRILDQ